MNNNWLIDTDIAVDYLRGLPQATDFLEKAMEESACYLSTITIAELYAGVREGNERHQLEKFLQAFEIISIDENIAQAGGMYRRDYGKKYGVGLADAIIAATAEMNNARLVTLNKKHFPMLKNVFTPYSKQ